MFAGIPTLCAGRRSGLVASAFAGDRRRRDLWQRRRRRRAASRLHRAPSTISPRTAASPGSISFDRRDEESVASGSVKLNWAESRGEKFDHCYERTQQPLALGDTSRSTQRLAQRRPRRNGTQGNVAYRNSGKPIRGAVEMIAAVPVEARWGSDIRAFDLNSPPSCRNPPSTHSPARCGRASTSAITTSQARNR